MLSSRPHASTAGAPPDAAAVPEGTRHAPSPGGASSPEALLRACAAGDKAALRRLYDLEAPRMLGVAMRLLRRRAAAEDAVQDAFVSIWRHAGRFDPSRGPALGWIYAILRNRALNMLRGEARLDLTPDYAGLDGPADDGEDALARLAETGALRRCLETLEPARRRLVLLAYTQGLTHGELAGRLRLPLGTVKSWLRRSLLTLRECLS